MSLAHTAGRSGQYAEADGGCEPEQAGLAAGLSAAAAAAGGPAGAAAAVAALAAGLEAA